MRKIIRKASLVVAILLSCVWPAFGDGDITVSNRSLYDEASGNVYHVPIWVDLNANGAFDEGEGIGTYAAALGQQAHFALSLQNDPAPLATSIFRSDIHGAYLGAPVFQSVPVRGYQPDERAPLRIVVWVGSTFETAGVRGSWDFVSAPLGGTPAFGFPVFPPDLVGWGNPNGSGFALTVPVGPVAGTDLIARASFSDARIRIETLLANDSNPDGDPVIFVGVDAVSIDGASLSVANGEIIYHAKNASPDSFFYTVRNSAGGVGRGRVEVSIDDVQGLSVASVGAEEVTRPYRGDVTIPITSLLANDSDPGGGALVFDSVDSRSANGAVIAVSGSSVIYKHSSDGPDSFFYTVRTAYGAKAKVRVNVRTTAPIGEIFVANRGLAKADGVGVYDAPVWVDTDTNSVRGAVEGIGEYASSLGHEAFLGLALQGRSEMFARYKFAIGTNGSFLATPGGTNVLVPGTIPGQRVQLSVKAWIGEDFESAKVKGSWDFTSQPLGGPREGDTAVPTPALSGWGDESGAGFALVPEEAAVEGVQIVIRPIVDWVTPIHWIALTNIEYVYFYAWTVFDPDAVSQVIWHNASVDSTTSVLLGGNTTALTLGTTENFVTATSAQVRANIPGRIFFSNRSVRRSTGPGSYNIPVWIDRNFNGRRDAGEGIGSVGNEFGETAHLGLFLPGAATPLATARFQTNAAGAFLEEPGFQEVTIPGAAPGSTPQLTLKAWIGDAFETAALKGAWDFTAKPLGGSGVDGVFETPDLSGWGDETNNVGYAIVPGVKPKTYGTVLARLAGQTVSVKMAELAKNDSDPEGATLTLVSVDKLSWQGATINVIGDEAFYVARAKDTDAPDYFEYTVQNAKGGVAKGRVDVVVVGPQGEFNTLLTIENLSNGAKQISFRGLAGANYLVQFRDGFEGAWQDLGPASYEAFGLFKISDPSAGALRFYRVLTQP